LQLRKPPLLLRANTRMKIEIMVCFQRRLITRNHQLWRSSPLN
jgi:hypothetical protein